MPRRDLTLAEKIVFLDKIKQQPQNTSQRRLMVITGLAKTTISRLIKQESELREEWARLRLFCIVLYMYVRHACVPHNKGHNYTLVYTVHNLPVHSMYVTYNTSRLTT